MDERLPFFADTTDGRNDCTSLDANDATATSLQSNENSNIKVAGQVPAASSSTVVAQHTTSRRKRKRSEGRQRTSVESKLPFFVDRIGSCDTPVSETAASSGGEDASESLTGGEQLSRRKRKRLGQQRQQIAGDRDSGMDAKITDAKRRVVNQLKLLAASTTAATSGPGSASSATADVKPPSPGRPGGEMCFLRIINDRLESGSDDFSAFVVEGEGVAAPPVNPKAAARISLGVKLTAHHAPAFIRMHQDDLIDFLTDMRLDKALWRVDADDLIGGVSSPGSRRSNSRYFSDSQDPMDAECCICQKRGHDADVCKRSGPVCILCGREGHPRTKCPSRLCPLCLAEGHRPEMCQRYALLLRHPCDRCGCLGHWKDQCPELWRQYHSTVAPGCPNLPMPDDSLVVASADDEAESKPEIAIKLEKAEEAEPTSAGGYSDWSQLVGQLSSLAYCCNCAQSGHSVHECIQPGSSLNRCYGSFHSQSVSCYDTRDPFAVDAGARRCSGSGSRSGDAPAASGLRSVKVGRRPSTSMKVENDDDSDYKESDSLRGFLNRPPPRIGESFIPVFPPAATVRQQREQEPQHRGRRKSSFHEELNRMRDLAKRLLPEGSSRSQLKKLTNRLRYWRRNGYQPTTPEQEDQVANRMEEWVLDVADTHNYMHKLNFKRRCRLLNSTGAALALIRGCRQYSEAPRQSSGAYKTEQQKEKSKMKNRKKKLRLQLKKTHLAEEPAESATVTAAAVAVVAAAEKPDVKPCHSAAGGGEWSGRLRKRARLHSDSSEGSGKPQQSQEKKKPRVTRAAKQKNRIKKLKLEPKNE